jgi:HSP20 family protein
MTRKVSPAPAPVSALALLQREIGALVHRLAFLDRSERLPSEWCPPVDVFEANDALVVVVEVPGLAPESLKVAFRHGCVVVTGERHACRNDSAVSFLCLERLNGRFERTIPIEGPLDVARARATLGRGLLTVTVPRLSERRGQERVVHIERESSE